MNTALGRFALLFLVTSSVNCGGTGGRPGRVAGNYADALDDKDFSRAYGYMSDEFRSSHTEEEFAALLRENPGAVRETIKRLERSPSSVDVSAVFEYGAGERLSLIEEGGRWRIASNPLVFYGQETPRQAIRSFVRAYKLKRWPVMLRFVPEAYAEQMTVEKIKEQFEGPGSEELASLLQAIEANLNAEIQTQGDQARMAYGDQHEVVLQRENGRWKIREVSEGR